MLFGICLEFVICDLEIMNILLVGSGAREHALARALKRSRHDPNLIAYCAHANPGILELAQAYAIGSLTDVAAVVDFAVSQKADWAIIGPEAPLEAGVVDALVGVGIPAVGPTKALAQIETSKGFARDLLSAHNIMACPMYRRFTSAVGVEDYLLELNGAYVIKADGLMSGKGVKVSGEHIYSIDEAINWCRKIIAQNMPFVIEEKLIGQEFSLMSFSDGEHLAHMSAVQDHKRAFDGDTGSNTGGMGSYSSADHSLPFLNAEDIEQAQAINAATVKALETETGEMYKGILYGGFMATRDGIKLIEYNARFGDPESMNVLAILQSDFVDICLAIIDGTLSADQAQFAPKATVCKYAVPEGYPDNPIKGQLLNVKGVINPDILYFGSVIEQNGALYELGSRALAVVGVADTIPEAERMAEDEINRIRGPLFHRRDIGTAELIQKRVEMMRGLRNVL